MANHRTGQDFPCMICGKMFYRPKSLIERGIRKTCGDSECKSASMRGQNNPFWGRAHNETTREKIRASKRANPTLGRTGPPKGYRHTPEAREIMRAAVKQRWIDNRDKMLAALPRGIEHHFHKEPEERRYRKEWTVLQRATWTEKQCFWCGSTERLNLDHIIPVFDGGLPEKWNAQTLCHPCNLWKVKYVDKPRYLARLSSEQATANKQVGQI